jgi:hypothetical protein
MSEKKLEANSIYNKFDANGDGTITDAEMAQADRLMLMNQKQLEIENQVFDFFLPFFLIGCRYSFSSSIF